MWYLFGCIFLFGASKRHEKRAHAQNRKCQMLPPFELILSFARHFWWNQGIHHKVPFILYPLKESVMNFTDLWFAFAMASLEISLSKHMPGPKISVVAIILFQFESFYFETTFAEMKITLKMVFIEFNQSFVRVESQTNCLIYLSDESQLNESKTIQDHALDGIPLFVVVSIISL